MDQSQDYVIHSLEQHLFFARIMKEHALFLKLGFLPPNQNLAQDAEHFLREFEALLSRAIAFSNRVVRNCVLFKETVVHRNASLSYLIADKNVEVLPDRTLMGHASYPIVLAKGSRV